MLILLNIVMSQETEGLEKGGKATDPAEAMVSRERREEKTESDEV